MSRETFAFLLIPIVFTIVGFLFSLINDEALIIEKNDFSIKEFTIMDFILFTPISLGVMFYVLITGTKGKWGFLHKKLLKKAIFEVDEIVMYGKNKAKVIRNEQTCKGSEILILMEGNYFSEYVEVSKLTKITKLHKALK